MDNNNIMNTADFDGLHEECGVFGAYDFDGEDVASTIYYGLFALQHRGQESCGIAVSDTNGPKGKVMSYKDMGLVNEVFNPENLEKLKGNPIVHAAYGRMFSYNTPATVNNENVTLDIISYEQKQFDWAKDYLLEGSIEAVQNEIYTGLLVYNPENSITVGDIINCEIEGKSIKVVGMLSDCPFNTTSNGIVICSENTFQKMTGQDKYTVIDIQLDKSATDKEVNLLHQLVGNDFIFADERMGNESIQGIYYCMCLFLYGFLVVIVLITIFNVINSISLSVTARTKQYGIFRAIGVSARQLTKMIIAEAVTYTTVGTIIGSIFGLIFHKVLFEILVSYNWGDPWHIPWNELKIIVLIILFSIIFAVYGPVKRFHHMSIVENINAQ